MSLENNSRPLRGLVANDAAWNSVDDAPNAAFDLPHTQPITNWQSVCGRSVLCACGAAGASHIGCIIALPLAFAGVAGSASISTVSVGASLVLTAAGAGIWYKLRGAVATRLEKTLTLTGMAAGAGLTLLLHFNGAVGGHDHHHDMEEALEWYRSRPAQTQLEIRQGAEALKVPLQDYIFDICGSELSAVVPVNNPAPGLDKL